MKRILLILLVISSIFACTQSSNTNSKTLLSGEMINNPAQIKFDTLSHDFGKMKEGEKPTFDFKFTNISKNALVLTEVHASCGCTTPYWPKDIIKPGEPNVIKVEYNSEGHSGKFTKSVSVTANTTPNVTVLTITGEVIPK